MSLCVVLQEKDKVYIGSDSAASGGDLNNLVRYNNTAKKIMKIGSDIVFCSGILKSSYNVFNVLMNCFNSSEVDIDYLSKFLQNCIGSQKDSKVFDVGVVVGRVKNGQSVVWDFSQTNNFEPVPHYGDEKGTQVWCAGIKVEEALKQATKYTVDKLSVTDIFKNTFEDVSYEGIGGYLTIFQADTNKTKMIYRESIKEKNVKWFNSLGSIMKTQSDDAHAVIADVICGELVMSEKLKVQNASGNFTITDDGLEATKGIYSVGINPNVISEIINVKVGGDNVFYIDADKNKLVFEGTLEGVDGVFKGTVQAGIFNGGSIYGSYIQGGNIYGTNINGVNITGSNITGTTIQSVAGGVDYGTVTIGNGAVISSFNNSGDHIYLTMGGVAYEVEIDLSDGRTAYSNMQHAGIRTGITGGAYAEYLRNGINIGATSGSYNFTVDNSGNVSCKTLNINGSNPLTVSNYTNYVRTNMIEPSLTASENIGFKGKNAASVTWCNDTFEPKSSSDFRLKYDIKSLEDLPVELFLELKPKQFRFKDGCDEYHKGIIFGFVAQQIESAFEKYGLNVWDYNLVEKVPVKAYTEEGLYVKDQVHRVNYINFHAWEISVMQKLLNENNEFKARLNNIESKLNQLLEAI